MVSAMAATTASVSPSRQDTRTENATPTTIAMMARRHQTRILGLAARCATLPRRSPMPGRGGSPPAGSAGGAPRLPRGLGRIRRARPGPVLAAAGGNLAQVVGLYRVLRPPVKERRCGARVAGLVRRDWR